MIGQGCSHLHLTYPEADKGLKERNSDAPVHNVFEIKEQRQIMYFFKAICSGVSLFISFPEIIASSTFSVKWESSGCEWFPEVFVPLAEGLSIIRRTKSLAENILKAQHYCSALQNVCSFGWGKEYFLEMCLMFFSLLLKLVELTFVLGKST